MHIYLVGENWSLFWVTFPLLAPVRDSLAGNTTHCTLLYYLKQVGKVLTWNLMCCLRHNSKGS